MYYVFLGFNCCQYFWGVCVSKLLARRNLALWVIRHWVAYPCCTIKFFLSFTSIQLNLWYSMTHYSQGLDSLPAREPCDSCKPFQEKNKLWNCRYIKKCFLLISLCVSEVLLQEHFCRITHLGWLSLWLNAHFNAYFDFFLYFSFVSHGLRESLAHAVSKLTTVQCILIWAS